MALMRVGGGGSTAWIAMLLAGIAVFGFVANVSLHSMLDGGGDADDAGNLREALRQQKKELQELSRQQRRSFKEVTGDLERAVELLEEINEGGGGGGGGKKHASKARRRHRRQRHSSDDDSSEEDDDNAAPTKRPAAKKGDDASVDESDSEEDETPRPATPAPKKKRHRSHKDKSGHKGVGIDDLGVRSELEKDAEGTIAVLLFTYKRAQQFRRAMDRILSVLNGDKTFRLFVSQDGTDYPEVTAAVEDYARRGLLTHLVHRRNDSGATPREKQQHFEAYYAISHHYGWALKEVFSVENYDRVVLLEDDLEVASDFFTYMKAAAPLFDNDDTLMCVSAWNDNGKAENVQSPSAVYRTDFFPGLGWMMPRSLWEDVGPIWPAGFWDDWLRQPKHRKGRACLRPEVPRTFMWCDQDGVSKGQFCSQYLSHMKLEDKPVAWGTAMDAFSLRKGQYDAWLDDLVESATEVFSADGVRRSNREYKIYYTTNREYMALATQFGLMTDFKDNVPRTAYKGIVTFRWNGARVHLVSRLSLYD
eukprot:Rhum_TRINITY_DN3652_c0_g1::Rhum_TRINITY_DN3652_c0_g1_i1::g.11536::m.11536/K00726/MGAT1; alpha-1,3-mannosyl-glycoprotein beta-1,2-N-acetylglucosaminyltransferase